MNIILFDGTIRNQFLPFTHTRPIADIRCGIFTMRERWEKVLDSKTTTLTETYLQQAFPLHTTVDNIYIPANLFANALLSMAIKDLGPEEALVQGAQLIAIRTRKSITHGQESHAALLGLKSIEFQGIVTALHQIQDIFSKNEWAIRNDFDLLTQGRESKELPEFVTAIGKENIFIEPGAHVYPCIINAAQGPVYIGKDAEIMEGGLLRGPLAVCAEATLKMGAKVYGGTTIGPGCKVGGEISNVVFFANSNKGHDGFLGNTVIGEWCNLGADTNCSNLKNNYEEVKIWKEQEQKLENTGLQFCGLFMGDHSKCSINTMFNTGTVVGVSCNIYGSDFPEKFIPSFSWGGSAGISTYKLEKAIDTANRMMDRRGKQLSVAEENVFRYVFEYTAAQRS